MGTDKNGKKTEGSNKPTFQRITKPEDATKYDYAAPEQQGPTVTAPSRDPDPVKDPEPSQPEVLEAAQPEESLQEPQPVEPKVQKTEVVSEEERQAFKEARQELREEAKAEAEKKYGGPTLPIDTLQKALTMVPENKGIKWGVIGSGQGGGRIAEEFAKFSYPTCVINTAKQDLTFVNIPEENKLFMDYALGGAGKDLTIGDSAIVEYQQEVLNLMRKVFKDEAETVVCCVGGGGGTGSGSAPNLVKLVSSFGLPVVVLYTLPREDEGALTKSNAIRTLKQLAVLSQQEKINALIIVDNSKIQQIYPNIGAGKLWKVANFDIVNTLNLFNTLCRCDTDYDSLDPMDFVRILSTGNCAIFGKVDIPLRVENGQVVTYDSELANAVLQNVQSGLLAEGFDLKETVAAGVIVTGRQELLEQIPAVNVHFMYNELNRLLGDAHVYHGMYKDNSKADTLSVYTLFSGLGLPYKRVDNLLKEAEQAESALEQKAADKSKMDISFETPTKNESQQFDKMRQGNTAFGRLAGRRGNRRRNVGRG